jgi:hypothetical protein
MFLTWNETRPKFRHDDPRERGFTGTVEDVNFDYDQAAVHTWHEGTATSVPCLGRSREYSDTYKVFRSTEQCRAEGFESLSHDFELPHPRDEQRLRYAQTSAEGLAREIEKAPIVAIYDADWQTQLWSWNKQVPSVRPPGSPARILLPLEIAVDSTDEMERAKSLVVELKERRVRA